MANIQNQNILTQERANLLQTMMSCFDIEGIKSLCFVIGVDFDELQGTAKSTKIRELIQSLDRADRLGDLLLTLQEQRPAVNWLQISSWPGDSQIRSSIRSTEEEQYSSTSHEDLKNLESLLSTEKAIKMLKMSYLMIKMDQFSRILSTSRRDDDYLWGWSVCNPERKKQVATPQDIEPRAASLVVSSFVLSAFATALDIPKQGVKSTDLTIGTLNSIMLRYIPYRRKYGIFGTPISRGHEEGRRTQKIDPNSRHIVAGITLLLRIIASDQSLWNSHQGTIRKISTAIGYLMGLIGNDLYSQDPETTRIPDSGTCALVLEFLDFLGAFEEILHTSSSKLFSREDLNNWRLTRIETSMAFLCQLMIQVTKNDDDLIQLKNNNINWFWDYKIDQKRFKNSRDDEIPPLDEIPKNLTLYHSARNLYLVRNYLTKPGTMTKLEPVVETLAAILVGNGGALSSNFPIKEGNNPHITNTAFFLNALLPDTSGMIHPQYMKILKLGIERLSTLFDKGLEESLQNVLDLNTDGMAMVFRLARYSPYFYSVNPKLSDELQRLNQTARAVQSHIASENFSQIEEELKKAQLSGCLPFIESRILKSREMWLKLYS